MGQLARVYPICPGGLVVCLGSGPSITPDDLATVFVEKEKENVGAVIAINSMYAFAPWATALYAADCRWWTWHKGATVFPGLKYSLDPRTKQKWPHVTTLKNTGMTGLEMDPTGLRTGMNSGYQAINLAVHFGAKKIVLLGYDMSVSPDGKHHCHPDHPVTRRSPYSSFLDHFKTIVQPLKANGVSVLNATRRTELHVFPKVSLEDALMRRAA